MVTITHPTVFPIQMPGPSDLAALLTISRNQLFPGAKPLADADSQEFIRQFTTAFQFVSTLRRTDEFQGRLGDWTGRAESWHTERGNTAASVSLAPLACACLSAGDISWQMPADRWPYDAFAALGWSGAVATPAWQTVLRTKTCRPMVPVKGSPYPQPEPTIRQLNMVHGTGARPFE
jgi:hypothetical protein